MKNRKSDPFKLVQKQMALRRESSFNQSSHPTERKFFAQEEDKDNAQSEDGSPDKRLMIDNDGEDE